MGNLCPPGRKIVKLLERKLDLRKNAIFIHIQSLSDLFANKLHHLKLY